MQGARQNGEGAIPAAARAIAVERRRGDPLTLEKGRRPIVVVIGMHRSGTSLCSHILSMLGVDMADEVGVNQGNQKGHWERWEIMALQDEILALLNRSYYTPQHDFPLPPAWWAEPGVRAVQTRIENFLSEKLKGKGLFGFKDPRTTRLLPMWLRIFKDLDLAPRFVLCLREPSQMARSLHERDGLDPAAGEYRALNYLADCFRYIPRHDLCIVNYEEWFGDYSDNLNGLMNFLDIEWEQSQADLGAAVGAIVDRDLRHSDERLDVARQPLVRSFHNLVAAARKDPSRRAEIDHFVNQFVAFQQLLWPFERAQRALSGIAGRVPELEGGLARLEAARAEQAGAAERLAASEARLAELTAAVENAEAAGRAREQALNEALAARGAELEAARAAEAGVAQRSAESEARQAELAAALIAKGAVAQQREQALNEALEARAIELEASRAEQASAARRLAASEARLAELAAALEAANVATAQREQELHETLAARGVELAATASERSALNDLLSDSEARLAERDAAARAEQAAGAQREQALRDAVAERDRELAGAGEAFVELQRQEQALRLAAEASHNELEAARAELEAAAGRLAAGEATRAALEAEGAAAGQRERALHDRLAERDSELDGARAAFAAAQERFLQVSGLAAQLPERDARIAALDAEAAAGQQRERALQAAGNSALAELDALRKTLAAAKRREQGLAKARASLEDQLGLSRAELAAAGERLVERDRDLEAARRTSLELTNQEQSLRAAHEAALGALEAARTELSATHARAQQVEAARAGLESELAGERAERLAAMARLPEGEARLARLQAALDANDAAARQREQALRTSDGAAKNILEAQVRALRDKLADTEAALTRSTATAGARSNGAEDPSPGNGGGQLERVLIDSGLFDVDWYRSEYKDAASSGLSPVSHFLQQGYLRGYRPNPLFDTRWYLERNEDVRRSGENPLFHYILTGFREGRDPGPGFQTGFYLESNPEVRDNGVNPLAHYLLHGRQAGERPVRHG